MEPNGHAPVPEKPLMMASHISDEGECRTVYQKTVAGCLVDGEWKPLMADPEGRVVTADCAEREREAYLRGARDMVGKLRGMAMPSESENGWAYLILGYDDIDAALAELRDTSKQSR